MLAAATYNASQAPSFAGFDSAIRRYLGLFGARPNRSSFSSPRPRPLEAGNLRSYWIEAAHIKKHWDSDRTAGYLAAYVDFAGSCFPGPGIYTREGFVHLDKGVMCSLLVGKCVNFDRGMFKLTEKGRALIAPFVRLDDDHVKK
jgi:hypothetical protein